MPISHAASSGIWPARVSRTRQLRHGHESAEPRGESQSGASCLGPSPAQLFGFEPDPAYPTYPFHPEAKNAFIAVCDVDAGGVRRAGFVPRWIQPSGAPEPLATMSVGGPSLPNRKRLPWGGFALPLPLGRGYGVVQKHFSRPYFSRTARRRSAKLLSAGRPDSNAS